MDPPVEGDSILERKTLDSLLVRPFHVRPSDVALEGDEEREAGAVRQLGEKGFSGARELRGAGGLEVVEDEEVAEGRKLDVLGEVVCATVREVSTIATVDDVGCVKSPGAQVAFDGTLVLLY